MPDTPREAFEKLQASVEALGAKLAGVEGKLAEIHGKLTAAKARAKKTGWTAWFRDEEEGEDDAEEKEEGA